MTWEAAESQIVTPQDLGADPYGLNDSAWAFGSFTSKFGGTRTVLRAVPTDSYLFGSLYTLTSDGGQYIDMEGALLTFNRKFTFQNCSKLWIRGGRWVFNDNPTDGQVCVLFDECDDVYFDYIDFEGKSGGGSILDGTGTTRFHFHGCTFKNMDISFPVLCEISACTKDINVNYLPDGGADLIEYGDSTTVGVPNAPVATLAALKGLVSPTDGEVRKTVGYWSSGDGGHGEYWFDAGSAETANDITIVQPDTGSGRWKLLHNGTVNVKQAGCKMDGSDDHDAFQACLNLTDVQRVYVPPGFLYTTPFGVTVSKTISGESRENSGIFRHSSSAAGSFFWCNPNDIIIKDLWIDGNRDNTTTGCHTLVISTDIIRAQVLNCWIRNAKVESGSWGSGLVISNGAGGATSRTCYVHNCRVEQNDNVGIFGEDVNDCYIIDCVVKDNDFHGIYLNNFDASLSQKIADVRIRGTHVYNNGANGIEIGNPIEDNVSGVGYGFPTARRCYIEDCRINDNGWHGILFYAQYGTITNCSIDNNGQDGIRAGHSYQKIQDNIIEANAHNGCYLVGSNSLEFLNNTVRWNAGTLGVGIHFAANWNIIVKGNIIGRNGRVGSAFSVYIERYKDHGVDDAWQDAMFFAEISNNLFDLVDYSGTHEIGIWIQAGCIGLINNNIFQGPDVFDFIHNYARFVKIQQSQYLWNKVVLTVDSLNRCYYPDALDNFRIDDAGPNDRIEELRPYTHQFVEDDGVDTCEMSSAGSGYTSTPSVSFSGGGGSGAAGIAHLWKGEIRGITVTNRGSGYTSAPSVSITGGGGSGATATATIGRWFQDAREITIHCNDTQGISIPNGKAHAFATEFRGMDPAGDATLYNDGHMKFMATFDIWYIIARNRE